MLHLGAVIPNLSFAADAHYHHLTDDIIVYKSPMGGASANAPRNRFPVIAVSGRTGKELWAVSMTYGAIEGVLFVEARDLDGDDLSP